MWIVGFDSGMHNFLWWSVDSDLSRSCVTWGGASARDAGRGDDRGSAGPERQPNASMSQVSSAARRRQPQQDDVLERCFHHVTIINRSFTRVLLLYELIEPSPNY